MQLINTNRFLEIFVCISASLFFMVPDGAPAYARDFTIGKSNCGVSIGNSKKFNGLRINISDHDVETVNGVNLTFLPGYNNGEASITGASLGLYGPEGGNLNGIQIGVVRVKADHELKGISFGLLGAGSEGRAAGLVIGGLGAGAGDSIKGITIGGLGAGAGDNITGFTFGGLGAGAGDSITGVTIGLVVAGAGENIRGITCAGIGAGAGGSITGITFGGLGAGAGDSVTGLTVGALGVGAGDDIKGLSIGGLGIGAGDTITGVCMALGTVRVEENGSLNGFAASAFNCVRGVQTGVSLGIVNYAHELRGIQIGLINYVRDNPRYRKMFPIVNMHFD